MFPLRRLLIVVLAIFPVVGTSNAAPPRPNIIVILCDDAGFADFGCFGGVADTPHIDRLAAEGMRFTRAYSNARCMPTRLSILTGLPPQLADSDLYSNIKPTAVTIAEVLREQGYATYMVGKWHLGSGSSNGNPKPIPSARGFDRFYGIWEGAAQPRKSSLLDPNKGNGEVRIIEDGAELPWDEVPEDYYVTFTWNDKAIKMIESTPEDQPFLLYLAHTAPHWPIDPFPSYVQAYAGRFSEGWDVLRDRILQNQKDLGIFPATQSLSTRFDFVQPFASATTSQRNSFTSNTEKYYAAVTEMDDSIGALRSALEASGRAENTLIIFLSDNGADNVIGGRERGMVSNTPFAGYKLTYFEAGIATPMVAWWPGVVPPNTINTRHEVHLEDFMATILDVTGASYPQTYNGFNIFPLHGRSFYPALLDPDHDGGPRFWHWEHDAQRGVWNDPWKALFIDYRHPAIQGYFEQSRNGWHLYNLETDRAESTDLATTEPGRLEAMVQSWKDWAVSVGWEPTGRWSADNPLDNGFRGTDGTTERAKPETYQRFFPLSGDQSPSGLIQVFGFDTPVRGARNLAFQAVNPTAAPMRVSVYGANVFPDIPDTADDDPFNMPDNIALPALGTLLRTIEFGGSMFDWSAFEYAVDFGRSGYTHATLVFELGDGGQEVDSTRFRPATFDAWARLHFNSQQLADPDVSSPAATAPVGDATNYDKFLSGRTPNEPGGLSLEIARLSPGELEVSLGLLPGVYTPTTLFFQRSSKLSVWENTVPRWTGYTLSTSGLPDRTNFQLASLEERQGFVRAVVAPPGGSGPVTPGGLNLINRLFNAPFVSGAGWALSSTQTDVGWVSHGSSSRWNLDTSGEFAFADNVGANNLVQIILDNKQTAGTVTLRFDAINSGADTLQVFVYGVDDAFRLNLFDTGGPKQLNDTTQSVAHTVLVNGVNFNQASAEWQAKEVAFTIPSPGFVRYGVIFRTSGVSGTEVQRIDNVRFE